MLSVYRIELRRSSIHVVLPVLLLVDLMVLFGRSRYWIGVWPEASVAAQTVTIFLGPVLAAVSAWHAGRASRHSMPEFLLASARPGWRAEMARFCATLTLGLIAYSIGALTAAVVSLPEAGTGFLWPSYLLLGAATLVTFAAGGHLAGRWWPSPWSTPVICALGSFVLLMAVGQSHGFYVLNGAPDVLARPGPIALHLALAGALVALAVCAPQLPGLHRDARYRPLPWRIRGTAAGAAAVTLTVLAGIPAAGELREDRPSSAVEPLCDRADKASPRVCVWPEHRKYLPDLTAMAGRLADIPQDWVKLPSVFYEEGLRRSELGDLGFGITEGHVRAAAIAMAAQVSIRSLDECSPPDDASRAWEASKRIDLWLEYRAMGMDPEDADEGIHMEGVAGAQSAARKAVVRSEEEQREWTKQERTHLREAGCAS